LQGPFFRVNLGDFRRSDNLSFAGLRFVGGLVLRLFLISLGLGKGG
jgi:hypothetical protein